MAENSSYHSPAEIHQYTLETGIKKTSLPIWKTLILSAVAGSFIAFAGAGSTVASFAVENYSLAALVTGAVFTPGLMMIVIAGGELFTGNVLAAVSVMNGRVKVQRFLLNLVLVLLGNFLGALLIALMTTYIGLPAKGHGDLALALMNKGLSKMQLSFGIAFVSGVLCNMVVSLAVWMTYAAKDIGGKVLASFFPIMLFALSGYEHVVANCYYLPAALLAAANPSWSEHAGIVAQNINNIGWLGIVQNMLPVALGNLVGGLVIAGCYQLVYGEKRKKR